MEIQFKKHKFQLSKTKILFCKQTFAINAALPFCSHCKVVFLLFVLNPSRHVSAETDRSRAYSLMPTVRSSVQTDVVYANLSFTEKVRIWKIDFFYDVDKHFGGNNFQILSRFCFTRVVRFVRLGLATACGAPARRTPSRVGTG